MAGSLYVPISIAAEQGAQTIVVPDCGLQPFALEQNRHFHALLRIAAIAASLCRRDLDPPRQTHPLARQMAARIHAARLPQQAYESNTESYEIAMDWLEGLKIKERACTASPSRRHAGRGRESTPTNDSGTNVTVFPPRDGGPDPFRVPEGRTGPGTGPRTHRGLNDSAHHLRHPRSSTNKSTCITTTRGHTIYPQHAPRAERSAPWRCVDPRDRRLHGGSSGRSARTAVVTVPICLLVPTDQAAPGSSRSDRLLDLERRGW